MDESHKRTSRKEAAREIARIVSSCLHRIRSRQTSSAKTGPVIPPGGSSAWKETFTLFFFPGQVLALGPLLHQASALALTFIPSLGLCPVILVFRRAIHEPPGYHHSSNCLLGARTENQQSGLKQELVQLRSQLLSESEAYLDYTAACLKAQAKTFLWK